MREHQAPSSERRFSVKTAANFTILLAANLLCSCQPTPRYAVGIEGGGQRIIPSEYVKMWDQTFTQKQWLELLRQRVHQPIAIWGGVGAGSIGEGTGGLHFGGLVFRDSRSLVLEHHLRDHDLLAQHPLMFLHLFGDSDPETVLTGIAAYRLARQERLLTAQMDSATKDRVADAFRDRLLSHPDVRVRWAAIHTLWQYGSLTPQDIERGLGDETGDIRVTTAFLLSAMMTWLSEQAGPENPEGPSPGLTPKQARAWRTLLTPILLDHVNDPHFFVRLSVGGALRFLFEQRFSELQGTGALPNAPALPERFDWVTSDWQARCATQEAWRQWWAACGTAATP